MYEQAPQLGSLKSFLKKSRAVVHKFIPRELSPTRMLEKMATDRQKKGDAKVAKIKNQTALDSAAFEKNQAALQKSLSSVSSFAPSSGGGSSLAPTPTEPSAPATDNTMLYAGVAALAVGVALYFRNARSGRRKRK